MKKKPSPKPPSPARLIAECRRWHLKKARHMWRPDEDLLLMAAIDRYTRAQKRARGGR